VQTVIADNIAKCSEAGTTDTLSVKFSLYGTGNSARYLVIKAIKE
jgi:hypothetical protein